MNRLNCNKRTKINLNTFTQLKKYITGLIVLFKYYKFYNITLYKFKL